ncbi:MAG: transketolase [Clostridia bacterium]
MPNNVTVDELKAKAKELRLNIAQTTFNATSGHVGGSMSSVEMLIALYFKYLNVDPKNPAWDERDRFVMSKGHCALSYVPTLAMRGFISIEEVKKNFNKTGSAYGMHPDSKKIPGCDASTGSLGHGMPIGVGMALGLRLKNINSKVVVMTGDGECQEGSNWEAAMSAAHFKLKDFIWIIDRNQLEIDGKTEEVMALEPLDKKVEAFGFKCIKCNGNDMAEVDKALAAAWANEGPTCIISSTTKGFGIKSFEGVASCHYCSFGDNEKDLKVYLDEINARG